MKVACLIFLDCFFQYWPTLHLEMFVLATRDVVRDAKQSTQTPLNKKPLNPESWKARPGQPYGGFLGKAKSTLKVTSPLFYHRVFCLSRSALYPWPFTLYHHHNQTICSLKCFHPQSKIILLYVSSWCCAYQSLSIPCENFVWLTQFISKRLVQFYYLSISSHFYIKLNCIFSTTLNFWRIYKF